MRHGLLVAAIGLALATPALAQTPPAAATGSATQPAPAPRPADVASSDAIVAALYQVISGDKDVPRDWDRFRSLFHPSGRLVAIGKPAEGPALVRTMTPEDYITRSGPLLLQGFHEREIARRVEHFGGVTHVFSTYEARRAAADAAAFLRGINSIQLFDDGQRWWIVSVYWQSETPQFPLPAQYLPPAS